SSTNPLFRAPLPSPRPRFRPLPERLQSDSLWSSRHPIDGGFQFQRGHAPPLERPGAGTSAAPRHLSASPLPEGRRVAGRPVPALAGEGRARPVLLRMDGTTASVALWAGASGTALSSRSPAVGASPPRTGSLVLC